MSLLAIAEPMADRWCCRVLEEQEQCSPEFDGMVRKRGVQAGPSPERRSGSLLYGGQGTKPRWDVEGALPRRVVEASTTFARGTELSHGWWCATPVETFQQERSKEGACLNSPKQD